MNLNGQVMMTDVFPDMYPRDIGCGCGGPQDPGSLGDGVYIVAGGQAVQIGSASAALLAAVAMAADSDATEPMFGKMGVDDCTKKFRDIYLKWLSDKGMKCTLENVIKAYAGVQGQADYIAAVKACAGVVTPRIVIAGTCD